jgi:hypothetical protein
MMDTFDWVVAILVPLSAAVALLTALRRHRKDYREFLEPALAAQGLAFVSSKYPGIFKVGPFPKFEIQPLRIRVNILGVSGQHSEYRIVTFHDPAGRPHEIWANLDFEGFRLRRIRWRAEDKEALPESARALLADEEVHTAGQMRKIRIWLRVFVVLSLVSSVVFLVLCAFFYARALHFKKTAVMAEGIVIKLKAQDRSHEGNLYYPVVRFTDKAGGEHSLNSSVGTSPTAYAVGDRASVLYDPADPNHAEINSLTGLWFLPLIFAAIGVLDLLTALVLLFAVPRILARAEKRFANA